MVKLQSEVRSLLKQRVKEQKGREKILRSILKDKEVWAALEKSSKKALELVLERYLNMEKN